MKKQREEVKVLNKSPNRIVKKPPVVLNLEKEILQRKIERIIIDNLPEEYKYAKLEEITKNSILIENGIRLPVFGKKCKIHYRTSILTREGSRLKVENYEVLNEPLDQVKIPSEQINTPPKVEVCKNKKVLELNLSESSLLCEKILDAINGKEELEGMSLSPLKKSKDERRKLVGKLKYQLPDGWEKPFNKNTVLEASVNKAKGSNSQGRKKLEHIIRKDKAPLINHTVQEKLTSKGIEAASGDDKDLAVSINRPKNYVIDDMIEKLKDYQHLLTEEDLVRLTNFEVDIETPLDFGMFLADLKSRFNEKYKSPYLNNIGVNLPYKSRRHDMGGAIEEKEWPAFFNKLEKLAERVKRKRKRIIIARKKRGKTLMPRKYIYKPPRRPDLRKDELYVSVFMDTATSASTITEDNDLTLPPITHKV